MKTFCALIFIFFSVWLEAFGQDTLLNQLNPDGKKHGYWVTYLDARLREVKREKAVYSYLKYYCDGRKFKYLPKWISKYRIDNQIKSSLSTDTSNVMEGTYYLTHRHKSFSKIELSFINGHQTIDKIIYDSRAENYEIYDYTDKLDGEEHSYHYYMKDGVNVQEGYIYMVKGRYHNNIKRFKIN